VNRRLLFSPLSHEIHDVDRRRAGCEAGNIVEVKPSASGYLITRASLRAIRDFAGEHVMVFLFSANIEEVLGRLSGKPGFFLQFPKCRVREMLSPLENSAR
jgi:hypothetical protein